MCNHPHPPDHSRTTLPGTNHAATSGRRTITRLILLLLLLLLLPHTTAAQNDTAPDQPPDPNPYGQQLNPSMTIIMLVLFSVLFLMGFFAVYIRQCAENRFRHSRSLDQSEGQLLFRRGAVHGIDASMIQSFPTFQYSSIKGLKIGKGSLDCAVCLNEFEDDDVLRLLPSCNHVFHSNCIDAWLSSRTTCPVCRANLAPKPGEKSEVPNLHVADPEPSLVTSNPPDRACIFVEDEPDINSDSQSPRMEEGPSTSKNKKPRSRSPAPRFTRLFLFQRLHSTGHSLVQPGEDCERFTLRLPDHVRDQIIETANLNRAKSGATALPRARSARMGYRRSESNGGWRSVRERNFYDYERFDQEDRTGRWGLSMTPSFLWKTGSVQSTRGLGVGGDEAGLTPPRSMARSAKSPPFGQLFDGVSGDGGERSADGLRSPDGQV